MTEDFGSLKEALSETYPLERELGRGGMATVYLAHDPKLSRKVAIKVMHGTLSATLSADRFLREVEIAANLQHPHILPIYDFGKIGDLFYYVMPYVEGESLKERLQRETQLPLDDAVEIATEVADALGYAHAMGIVHRDVKPGNILLSGRHALLADFGVARALEGAGSIELTASGFTVGTPPYMSPEQATGEGEVDARTDIYALGAVFYEMLAGEPPFTGPTPQAVLARSLTERFRPIDQVRDVPDHVALAIEGALQKVPADRLPSAGAFADTLHGETTTSTRYRRTGRRKYRRRVVAGIATLFGAAALALFAVLGDAPFGGDGGGPTTSPDLLAVLPFRYTGTPGYEHLSDGLPTLLSTVLDGIGDLRTVDPAAVIGVAVQRGGVGTPGQARSVVEILGAGRYVLGTINAAGSQLTVTASLYETGRDTVEANRSTAEADAGAGIFDLVNRLSVDLLRRIGIEGTPRDLESLSTTSVISLNDYLRGEAAIRRGDYSAAVEALQRATSTDSLFALAWARLSYALQYVNPGASVPPAQRAVDLSDRLSDRHRRLAVALLAAGEARADDVARAAEEILVDYPNDIDALFLLADTRIHYGPLHAWPMDSIGADFDRVLALDANHSEALYHRPWAAGLDGEFERIGFWTDRLAALGPHPIYTPVYAVMRAVVEGDSASIREAVEGLGVGRSSLGRGGDDFLRMLAISMVSTLRDLGATERVAAKLFDDPDLHPDVRALGHLIRAHQLVGLGKWTAAREQLSLAGALSPAAALEARAYLLLSPFAPTSSRELAELRTELETWDAEEIPRTTLNSPFVGFIVPHDGWHPQIRLYLLGALLARLGHRDAALRHALQLARSGRRDTEEGIMGRTFARNVRALVAFEDRRPEAALVQLEQPGLQGRHAYTVERTYSSPIFSGALERFRQADALAQLDRDREALNLYASIWMLNCFDLAYLAPSHLEQARLHELRGEMERAIRHYTRFAELWAEADPELQPRVEAARQRVLSLSGD